MFLMKKFVGKKGLSTTQEMHKASKRKTLASVSGTRVENSSQGFWGYFMNRKSWHLFFKEQNSC